MLENSGGRKRGRWAGAGSSGAGRAHAEPRRQEGLTLEGWGQGHLAWQERWAGARTGHTWAPGSLPNVSCSLQTRGKSRKRVGGQCGHVS